MKTTVLLFHLFGLALCARAADESDQSNVRIPFERGSQIAPVVSVYYRGGIMNELDEELVACVWADGRAVWSESPCRTGRPLYTGQVALKRLKAFFAVLHSEGFFPLKWEPLIATDGPQTIVNVFDGGQHMRFASLPIYYLVEGKAPKHVRNTGEAGAFLRHQIESLMPRPGQKLRSFRYEVREYPPAATPNHALQRTAG